MLISYSVSNVLSFLDPVILNMIETRKTKRHPEHIADVACVRVLRTAIIYGPNASGKSNLLHTIAFLLNAFGRNDCHELAGCQFRMDSDGQQRVMRWEIVYSYKENLFQYIVESDGETVSREDLFDVSGEPEILFSRDCSGIHLGRVLTECSWFDEKIQSSAFYLKKVQQDGVFEIDNDTQAVRLMRSAFLGLRNIEVLPADAELKAESLGRHFKIQEFQRFLLQLMQNADLGITDIRWIRVPRGGDIENYVRMHFSKGVIPENALKFLRYGESFVAAVVRERRLELYELQCDHSGTMMRAGSESDGTMKILNYSVFLYEMQTEEKTWIIDEMDRGLHPDLSWFIVQRAFANPKSKSQLIFTAHDVTLMSLDLFRADEIWYTTKMPSGASNLYSLYQFQIRPDVDVEKRYREGAWGSKPKCVNVVGDGKNERKTKK